jgi:hypothetical protein
LKQHTATSANRICFDCFARIARKYAAGDPSTSKTPTETQANLLGGCLTYLSYIRARHNECVDNRAKTLKDKAPRKEIEIILGRSFNSIDPSAPDLTGGKDRPDITHINHKDKEVHVEEHTYVDEATLHEKAKMKRDKYEATVADLKRKSPLLAGYRFTHSIFAVGHGCTVPQCTVDATNDIPSPPKQPTYLCAASPPISPSTTPASSMLGSGTPSKKSTISHPC